MQAVFKPALVQLDSLLPSWMRRLVRNQEWQKSSAVSALAWVLATIVIYKLVERLGHGWKINAAVSFAFDSLMYFINKLWAFGERKTTYAKSGIRNSVAWILFFLLNAALAWLLMSQADIGTLPARGLLACYGIAMNPVIFTIRDRVIFNQLKLRKIAVAGWQAVRRT